jgi:DNA helicase HerA-like ATPase
MADVEHEVRADHSDAAERLALRISNLAVSRWSVWATAEESSLVDITDDWRVLVLDVGSLDEARERALVSLALLGVLRRRPNKRSVLIVMDEAHNVCPPEATTPLGRVVTDYTVWIAGEGRKYGIHLLLATQRPQKIHPNVLSQCDNLLLMRVNSSEDIDRLVTTFSHVPEGMIREASGFRLGEMLAAGPLAPVPLRLRTGRRLTPEGGADLPTTWATPNGKAKP